MTDVTTSLVSCSSLQPHGSTGTASRRLCSVRSQAIDRIARWVRWLRLARADSATAYGVLASTSLHLRWGRLDLRRTSITVRRVRVTNGVVILCRAASEGSRLISEFSRLLISRRLARPPIGWQPSAIRPLSRALIGCWLRPCFYLVCGGVP